MLLHECYHQKQVKFFIWLSKSVDYTSDGHSSHVFGILSRRWGFSCQSHRNHGRRHDRSPSRQIPVSDQALRNGHTRARPGFRDQGEAVHVGEGLRENGGSGLDGRRPLRTHGGQNIHRRKVFKPDDSGSRSRLVVSALRASRRGSGQG